MDAVGLWGGEDADGIGADGEKGHVAQVQQASQPDHDVEPQAQDDIDAHGAQRIVPVLA